MISGFFRRKSLIGKPDPVKKEEEEKIEEVPITCKPHEKKCNLICECTCEPICS
jgi:hypothetical protein